MADGGPDALKEGLVSRTHSAVSMDSDQGASAGAAAKTAQKKVNEWRTAPPPDTCMRSGQPAICASSVLARRCRLQYSHREKRGRR